MLPAPTREALYSSVPRNLTSGSGSKSQKTRSMTQRSDPQQKHPISPQKFNEGSFGEARQALQLKASRPAAFRRLPQRLKKAAMKLERALGSIDWRGITSSVGKIVTDYQLLMA